MILTCVCPWCQPRKGQFLVDCIGRQPDQPVLCQLGAGRGVDDLECFRDRQYPRDAEPRKHTSEAGRKAEGGEGLPETLGREVRSPNKSDCSTNGLSV